MSTVVVGSPDIDATLRVYRALGATNVCLTPAGATLTLADITLEVEPAAGPIEPGLQSVVLGGMQDADADSARSLRSGALGAWLSS
ncbi:hypothetical protein MWU75_00715 [Ornithinimicrobium sp. F0845]|uniref:hypothetical protein n=1 Tax=Ornithinimicrobium sp. F0845 TaxID=2926412 RepID=UPI001FF195CA|nr:hypothetical protein [Ornithinimicrobium sp. F0845]MCK0110668.1 hypothetical protein [Ornithinimicrobium sp. F0845]